MPETSDEKVQARQKLLTILWKVPGLPRKICPAVDSLEDPRSGDDLLLRAVARSLDPQDALRCAGMAETDIESTVRLLPSAFPAGTVSLMGLWHASRKTKMLLVFFLTSASVAFTAAFKIFTNEWREGKCWLDGYDGECPNDLRNWNCPDTCAACKFRVGILDLNTGDRREMLGFEPEFRTKYRGGIEIVGEPFRCCGRDKPTDALNCCSGFFDNRPQFEIFCDNWPHRADSKGKVCPHGSWICSYRLEGVGEGFEDSTVAEVRPYVDQTTWHMLYTGLSIAILSLQLLTDFVRRVPRAVLPVLRRCFGFVKASVDELKDPTIIKSTARVYPLDTDEDFAEDFNPSCNVNEDRKSSLVSSSASVSRKSSLSSATTEFNEDLPSLCRSSNSSRRSSHLDQSPLDPPVVIDRLQRDEWGAPARHQQFTSTGLVWRPPTVESNAPKTSRASRAWTARYQAENGGAVQTPQEQVPVAWDQRPSTAASLGGRHKHSERPPSRRSTRVSRAVAGAGG